MNRYRFTHGQTVAYIEANTEEEASHKKFQQEGWKVEEVVAEDKHYPCGMHHNGQRDMGWDSVKMGHSNATVGHYGCTITSISNLSGFYCNYKDPEWCARHFDFTHDGLLLWQSVKDVGMRFSGRHYSYSKAHLLEILRSKNDSCIIQVPLHTGSGRHWLALTNYHNGRLIAFDPWYKTGVDVLAKYGKITGYAVFTKE